MNKYFDFGLDKLYFDIETTGLDTDKDRIVQLGIIVQTQDGQITVKKSKLYNPQMPISESASDTHGIKDEDVQDAPLFSDDAKKLKKLFENKVIIGYNIMRFDIPLLVNEFKRCGVEINFSGKFIDVLNIEKKINDNKLSTVYKRYTGEPLSDAHDALKDIDATRIIFEHQYDDLFNEYDQNDKNEELSEDIYKYSDTDKLVDFYGKLARDEQGYLTFNFGKSKGKRIIDDPNYASWILKEAFPEQVKKLIREEQLKYAGREADSVPASKKARQQKLYTGEGYVPLNEAEPF